MPNYDSTGPYGKGPVTGFGRGYCVIPITSSEQELEFLRNQAYVFQAQLKQIKTRIKEVKIKKEVHHAFPRRALYTYPRYGAYGFRPFTPWISREQELEFLKSQAKALRDNLK